MAAASAGIESRNDEVELMRIKKKYGSIWDNIVYIVIMGCSIKRLSGIDSWALSKTG